VIYAAASAVHIRAYTALQPNLAQASELLADQSCMHWECAQAIWLNAHTVHSSFKKQLVMRAFAGDIEIYILYVIGRMQTPAYYDPMLRFNQNFEPDFVGLRCTGCTIWLCRPRSCWGRSSKAQTLTHRPTCQQGGCVETFQAAPWQAVRTSSCGSASISCSATARTAQRLHPAASSSCPKPSSCCPFTAWVFPSRPASGMLCSNCTSACFA